MRASAFKTVLVIVPLLAAVPAQANVVIDYAAVRAVDGYSQAQMDSIAGCSFYFEHASVGSNMVNGLNALHDSDHGFYQLTTISASGTAPGTINAGTVYEYARGNPGWEAKVNDFASDITSSWGGRTTFAMNKFCWIDQDADWSIYADSIAALEAANPGTVFVYMTMPLTPEEDSDNILRNQFNDSLRDWAAANDKVLFDVADIEAHDSSGVLQTFTGGVKTYQKMAAEWTSDGGHPDINGSDQLLARGFYAVAQLSRTWMPEHILEGQGPGGRPAIAWRHPVSGEIALWQMSGRAVTGAGTIYNGGTGWNIEHVADFDGDGKEDLLWRNSVYGAHTMWLMNGMVVTGSGPVYTPDSNWRIIACGDYNGDGSADLLWRNNADGEVVVFAMNGTAVLDAKAILPRNLGWTPVPVVVDLDGDGFDDILWTRDGGADVAAWLMASGITVKGGGTIYSSGPAYSLVVEALGDFDADGRTDLVWRKASTGETIVWLMNGINVSGFGTIYSGDSEWMPSGAADFDGDGDDDILWRNTTTGDYAMYLMNGATISSSGVIYHYTTEWTIRQVAQLDSDGKADLVWQNGLNGDRAVWLMNGLLIKDAGSF